MGRVSGGCGIWGGRCRGPRHWARARRQVGTGSQAKGAEAWGKGEATERERGDEASGKAVNEAIGNGWARDVDGGPSCQGCGVGQGRGPELRAVLWTEASGEGKA